MCGFGLGFWVEEIGVMGHAVGPKFKAQMNLGTLVPYRSNAKSYKHKIQFTLNQRGTQNKKLLITARQ